MQLTIIDNYDSFTYNLYQILSMLGAKVNVFRNDEISIQKAGENANGIVISPGPGTPDDAGISMGVINHYAGKIPILGVCLGHQAIGQVFGSKVVRAPKPIHGMSDFVRHNGKNLFLNIEENFQIGRYHSLVVDKQTLGKDLTIAAENDDGLIMALEHKKDRVYGVQFHPESILTPCGDRLLQNFLDICKG